MPESVQTELPAKLLADAWQRDEKATELNNVLKGCQVYLIGPGPRKSAIGRLLSRRLKGYRCYDVPLLMCSTYQAMGSLAEPVSIEKMCADEPLPDVDMLGQQVLLQVQPYARSVITSWDGAVGQAAFAVMQQGIVVHIDEPANAAWSSLPAEAMEDWTAGYSNADLTVSIPTDVAVDDAVIDVVMVMLAHIEKNPAKAIEWKAKADAELAKSSPQDS